MKQIWTIGTLILVAALTAGCGNESERMANKAKNMVRRMMSIQTSSKPTKGLWNSTKIFNKKGQDYKTNDSP